MTNPDRIYLQAKDEDGELPDEVTWCVDRIHDTDVEYVLATELERAKATIDYLQVRIAALGTQVKEYAEEIEGLQQYV